MLELLNNPWVVGIGGGVLSGFLVTYFTRSWLSKRDEKEFRQKATTANQEILYAIRPCISEGVLPSRKVIIRVIKATARKYELEQKDLLTSIQIIQNLTKEVMDSSFISSKDKERFCEMLSDIIEPTKPAEPDQKKSPKQEEPEVTADYRLSEYRARMLTVVSVTLGLISSIMTILVFFLQRSSTFRIEGSEISRILGYLAPAFISIVVVTIMSYLFTLINKSKSFSIKLDKKTDEPNPPRPKSDDGPA